MRTPFTAPAPWTPGSCASKAVATEARMRALRYAATEGLGLRATGTRRRTRSRPSSTASCRAARRAGSRCAARTASSARCWPSRARRRRPTAREHGLVVRDRRDESGHGPRPDPRARSCRCCAGCTPAPTRTCSHSATSGRGLPRALEASLVELLASTAGTQAADLGGGVRAVREYGTLRLEGTVEWGPWTLDARARRPRGARTPAGRPSGRPPQEGAGSARGREGAESGAGRPGRSSFTTTRWSPCRGSPSRPDGRASSRPGGRRDRGRPAGWARS